MASKKKKKEGGEFVKMVGTEVIQPVCFVLFTTNVHAQTELTARGEGSKKPPSTGSVKLRNILLNNAEENMRIRFVRAPAPRFLFFSPYTELDSQEGRPV